MMLRKHIVFLAAVLLGAFACGLAANAKEPPVCTGKDLIAELKVRDPAAYERLKAEAAKIPNGDSVFWRIDGPPGTKPSWLLGTIHLSDPRVVNLPPHIDQALDQARVVALEKINVLDPHLLSLRWRIARFQVLPPNTSLFDLLGKGDAERLSQRLTAIGIDSDSYPPYQPWIVVSTISYSICELTRQNAGLEVLDGEILNRSIKNGSVLVSLENPEAQAALLAAIPLQDQLAYLVEALRLRYTVEDDAETAIQSWSAGRIAERYVFTIGASELTEEEWQETRRVEKVMLDVRNAIMRDSALPHLKDGNVFIAVGMFHLIGENGLVELLREAGYKVTPVR